MPRFFACQFHCVLALVTASTTFTATAGDLPREQLIYTTLRPANTELYLFEPGSAASKAITHDPALDYDPTFSPDGRWVVFCSERAGNPDLYAQDLTKSEPPQRLTSGQFMSAAPAFTPDGKTLLFVSDRDGNADIFSMPFDPAKTGSADRVQNLTHSLGGDYRPSVSPDGKTIAFSSDRDSFNGFLEDKTNTRGFETEIYAMDIDGSHVRRLTNTHRTENKPFQFNDNGSPIWSADGRSIYFYSNRDDTNHRIWSMDADGSNQDAISPAEIEAVSPALMRDGRIAFTATKPDPSSPVPLGTIMSMKADGSEARTESGEAKDCSGAAFDRSTGRMICSAKGSLEGMAGVSNGRPFLARGTTSEVRLPDRILEVQALHRQFCSISPDGREFLTPQLVTAVESRDKHSANLVHLVANARDGSAAREVFRPASVTEIWATSWSRRADVIAFTTGPQFAPDKAVVDIWSVHGDGTGPKNLTDGKAANNAFPDVTADGKQIVFRSTRDGNKEIYLMNSDGTNVRRITNDPANDTMPSISPNGDMIAFTSTRAGGLFQIFLQRLKDGKPDGSPRPFAHSTALNMHTRFSGDGKWIAFTSARGWLNDESALSAFNPQPYGEIFVAPVDGSSDPVRVTHNKWEDSLPTWGVIPR
ncbi:MAG: TolB protein [Verrucomicrobiota bacterium]|jgi:Tol biopolymer transport system component